MNEIDQAPTPEILPPVNSPPNYGPVAKVANVALQKRKFPIWAIVILLTILLGGFVLSLRSAGTGPDNTGTVVQTPTPTTIGVDVPTRPLSAIATDSAFIDFETQLDIVTRGVQNAQIENQSLLPPRLDLPLGF